MPLGIAHGLLAGAVSELWPAAYLSGYGWLTALFMVPAAWITGWAPRGRIAAARGPEIAAALLWCLLLGAWIAGSLFALLAGVASAAEGDWRFALGALAFFWALSPLYCVLGSSVVLPSVLASIPLTFAAILLLRRASGGAVEIEGRLWPRRAARLPPDAAGCYRLRPVFRPHRPPTRFLPWASEPPRSARAK